MFSYLGLVRGGLKTAFFSFWYLMFVLIIFEITRVLRRKFIRSAHKSREVKGKVSKTYTKSKFMAQAYTGRMSNGVSFWTAYFDCIEIVSVNGEKTRIYVDWSNNKGDEYKSHYAVGDQLELNIWRYDSFAYMSEVLFNKYYSLSE